ncbi:MAG: signal peptidase II [Microbacterium sp.]|nr:signal peptidase II [Microbacterium sp.]
MVIAAAVITADQWTKRWAVSALSDGGSRAILPPIFEFQLAFNRGAAFSIGTDFTWLLGLLAGAAAVAITIYLWRVGSLKWAVGLGAILGGAISHAADRLMRGGVIDFIGYFDLFIGNVADIAIVGGGIYLVVLAMLKVPSVAPKKRNAVGA